MSDTKSLLHRIAAFRERLESAPTLAGPAAQTPAQAAPALPQAWLGQTLRSLSAMTSTAPPKEQANSPGRLLGRARQLVAHARELVAAQRDVSDDPYYLRLPAHDPLAAYHIATVAATDAALRLVQTMPDSAEHQARVCDGLETVLGSVRDRLALTTVSLDRRRKEFGRIERVARLLSDVQARRLVPFGSFVAVAEEIIDDARAGLPLRFPAVPADPVPRFVAAHAVAVAGLMARLVPYDFEWTNHQIVPVALALMMDVGMLAVPAAVLGKAGPLTPDERRSIDRHPAAGADLLRELMPELGPLADVMAKHHERPDGTGYPAGATDLPPLASFLHVADDYVGRMTDRPHRPAHDPRAALTDLLLAAEEGKADKDFVEYLLKLSFYPLGTVVELTDGRVGVVVSVHANKIGMQATARPVVSVLTDSRGSVLPRPEVVDLAGVTFGGIVRAVPTAERVKLFAASHPELCG